MINIQLQELLKKYPDNMPVKLLPKNNVGSKPSEVIDFTEENILQSSEGAWVDDEAPVDTWDCEDGKIRHKGKKYLLINPIIT